MKILTLLMMVILAINTSYAAGEIYAEQMMGQKDKPVCTKHTNIGRTVSELEKNLNSTAKAKTKGNKTE